MKPALVLVDLQRDYLDDVNLEPAADSVIVAAGELLELCRARHVPVIHVYTTVRREAPDQRMPHWRRDEVWRCVEGTAGHASPPALLPRGGEPVVHKTFFSAFSTTHMAEAVAASGADTLLLCGVHQHACVRATATDAYQRGLSVLVVEEATGSHQPLGAAASRAWLQGRVAHFIHLSDVCGILDSGQWHAPQVDVMRAGVQCRTALPAWRRLPASERTAVLLRVADQLETPGEAERLARLMAGEIGKPVFEGRGEVLGAAALLRDVVRRGNMAGDPGVRRRPLGGVALITPWNNPIFIPLGKIGPALLYGNCIMWKPHELATTTAREVQRLVHAAGCPPGVLTLLEGDAAVARALMSGPYTDAITITGSSVAGASAQYAAALRRLPLQAELGGNNAAIVWSDADVGHAAKAIAEGAFVQAGQRCTANRRAIVADDCYERFVELLTAETARLPWGDPLDERTRIGPLVSVAQRVRVENAVRAAEQRGARVLRLRDDGPSGEAFMAPTLVCCDAVKDSIVQQETFGPVLVLQRATTWEQALTLCNGVRQGLAAALFSASRERIEDFLERAEAGILKINQATAGADPRVPFGGWKHSGIGPAEHGDSDREFYTRVQAVYYLTSEG